MRKGSHWSTVVFKKEVFFHEFDFEISDLEFEVLKSSIWKHTTIVWQECFFFHYYLATSMTDWAQIFTGLLFYVYVEIHQLWRLVFDNYNLNPKLLDQTLQRGFQKQNLRWIRHGNSMCSFLVWLGYPCSMLWSKVGIELDQAMVSITKTKSWSVVHALRSVVLALRSVVEILLICKIWIHLSGCVNTV